MFEDKYNVSIISKCLLPIRLNWKGKPSNFMMKRQQVPLNQVIKVYNHQQ